MLNHNMLMVKLPFMRPQKRFFFNLSNAGLGVQHFKLSKKVSVPPSLLFRIVSDVSKYHEFLPFVSESFIDKWDEETKLPKQGGLRVGWNQFDEAFTCNIVCDKDKSVRAESVTILLFEFLDNKWTFQEVKNQFTLELLTFVNLELRYQFKNPLYNSVSSLFQNQVSQIMMKAFEERALDMKIKHKLKDRINH